jgi:2'-5' RNA ligase
VSLGYVMLVDEEVHNYVRRVQVQIHREYGAVSGMECTPHLTLKQGFAARTIEPFERYFDRLVAETDPFEITLRGIGSFDDGVIYLDVVQNGTLDSLRRRVVSDLSNGFGVSPNALEDDQYHFHATLAQGLPRASFERARQALQGEQVEFRFICDTLGLLCDLGTGWMTYKRSRVAAPGLHPLRP